MKKKKRSNKLLRTVVGGTIALSVLNNLNKK
jgi:hypothetical protein